MNTIKIKKNKTKLIAHRGVSSLERENTISAFVAAGNRSYFGIETDIHLSKDGKFVISHDSSLLRLTNKDVFINDTTFEELLKYNYLDIDGNVRSDLRVPLLSEYLSICKKYEKHAIIELKDRFTDSQIDELIVEVEKYHSLKKTVFIDFKLSNLIILRSKLKKQPLQYLSLYWLHKDEMTVQEWFKQTVEDAKKYNLDLDLGYPDITQEMVDLIHENNLKLNVWTVNNKEDAQKLISFGVDYITTETCE